MIAPTHYALGMLAASFAAKTLDPAVLVIGGLASLLPDVDHPDSILGKLLFPISNFINKRFGHRSITHSWVGLIVIFVVSCGVFIYYSKVAIAIFAGYISALFGDLLTKSGIKLLWPVQDNFVIFENPALRFKTGGVGELITLIVIFNLTILNFNAISNGGIAEVFNNYYAGLIGRKSAAVDFYNRHSSENLIGLEIVGYMASDRRPVNSKFRVIYIEGTSTIYVQNPVTGYLYKLEQEIIVEKVKPYKEAPGSATADKLFFNDEQLKLKSGEVYYFGKLTLEDIGSVPLLKPSLEYLLPYKLEGEVAVISGAKKEQIPFLNQYVTGELTEVKLEY